MAPWLHTSLFLRFNIEFNPNFSTEQLNGRNIEILSRCKRGKVHVDEAKITIRGHVIERKRGVTSHEARKCGERILPRFPRIRSFIFGRTPGRDGHVDADPRSVRARHCVLERPRHVSIYCAVRSRNARLLIRAARQILAPFRESERYRRIAPMLLARGRTSRNRESQAHNRRIVAYQRGARRALGSSQGERTWENEDASSIRAIRASVIAEDCPMKLRMINHED